ncbi:protein of unknown function [Taphrina deformans PYCC 5710]|uniref:MICOS complex subunit n=1 Tax=Taphrina deformans (strain PYCC 5710 / ATCC 11124 / CBS 356.35 / IMI 108563 / JCM 9778 / NBRC 8474) TaxID=1097556 RepID=R4XJ29_TAPDE|nr:protein of unknown function [Taphrina deformans PYCC 5710]|eukprot:CCG84489.1 protein of unknown function [Taphrina deformans PYCC 5710]
MAITNKLLGTAAVLGTATYASYKGRNPTMLDSPRLPTKPVDATKTAYDQKEEPMYLIPEQPSQLQQNISGARRATGSALQQADAHLRYAVDQVVATEHKIERTIKSLRPKNETLLPGAIYVAVIGLSGSIVSRNRAFPLRFLTPLLFFVVSSKIILPETSANVGDLIYSWEAKVPEVKKWHDFTTSHVAMGLYKAGEVVEDAEHMIDGAVKGSKDVFEKNSGIKLPK